MKQQELVWNVEDRFAAIKNFTRHIPDEFDNTVIYAFRHEVKMLRAFLRLMSYSQPVKVPLVLPKNLKAVYGYVGIIRNLQLQQKCIGNYCSRLGIALPGNYLGIIKEEESFWRKEASGYIDKADSFYDDEQSIISSVPSALTPLQVRAFTLDKITEVKALTRKLDDDDALHKIRKLLKDILFNWKYIQLHLDVLPTVIQEENELQSLCHSLGLFRDVCIALNHLQAAYVDRIKDPVEKQALQQVEQEWLQQKAVMKTKIISIVRQFEQANDKTFADQKFSSIS